MLESLVHLQKPTPIRNDSSTETGFVYDNIHMKISKSWDMHYYCLQYHMTQEQFKIYWQRGVDYEADYLTKHHAVVHLRNMQSRYIRDKI